MKVEVAVLGSPSLIEENPNPGRFEKREQTIHEIPGP